MPRLLLLACLAATLELDILRLLACVRLCSGATIHELICPTLYPSNRTRLLARLTDAGLIWRTKTLSTSPRGWGGRRVAPPICMA